MVTVNLIPESVQAAQARRRHLKRWAACLAVTAVFAVVPAVVHWRQHVRVDALHVQNDKLQTDLATARAELKTATAAANDAFLRIERAKALRSKRAWSGMLALIGSCLPKECWLTSIATDPDVPSAAPPPRKTSPPSPTAEAMGHPPGTPVAEPARAEARGSLPEKQTVVTIDAPRKLRMTGAAVDETQPLFFVAKLKESQAFREVILERCLRDPAGTPAEEDESPFRFELVCTW